MEILPRSFCGACVVVLLWPLSAHAQVRVQGNAAVGVGLPFQAAIGEFIPEAAVDSEALLIQRFGVGAGLGVIGEGANVGSLLARLHVPRGRPSQAEPFAGVGVVWPLYGRSGRALAVEAGEIHWSRAHPGRGFLFELHDLVFPDVGGHFVTVRVGIAFR